MAKVKKKEVLTLEEKLEQALVPVDEQPYEVPENWCWIHLLEAFDNLTDSKKKLPVKDYLEAGMYPIVDQGQEFIGGYTDAEDMVYNSGLPVVIFGDHTRCMKYINFPFVQGADGVKVLKPKAFWDSKAFYYALKSVEIPNMGYRRHYPLFKDFCIPVPPLEEQQRIVEQIESLFGKLDEAKEKAQEVLDSYEIRRASILHKALNGELTTSWRRSNNIDAPWEELQLGDITDIKSSKRVYKEDYVEEGVPFFRSSEVVDLYDTGVTEPIYFITEEKYDEIRREKGVPEEGNLLITSVGTIGKTWIVDDRKFYYKDGNLTEVVKNDRLDMRFLQMFIMSEEFNHQVIDTVSGSAYNALTIVKFKKIWMKLPSVAEQNEIVRVVGELLKKEQQVKESIEQVLVSVDMMKKSILAKAFSGKLGTNNPEEESAIGLLEQILLED